MARTRASAVADGMDDIRAAMAEQTAVMRGMQSVQERIVLRLDETERAHVALAQRVENFQTEQRTRTESSLSPWDALKLFAASAALTASILGGLFYLIRSESTPHIREAVAPITRQLSDIDKRLSLHEYLINGGRPPWVRQ